VLFDRSGYTAVDQGVVLARGQAALRVRIAGTGSVVPGRRVTTEELTAQVSGTWDAARIEARTGIAARHFVAPGTTAAALGAAALDKALTAARLPARALTRVIFVDSLGGDMLIPATANDVMGALGITGACDCFDLNNSCLGFLSALDVAARGVATGQEAVAIVVAELGSRFISPDDPRPFFVFGDGAAAVIVTASANGEGLLGSVLRNQPGNAGGVRLAHGGHAGLRETIRFTKPNEDMLDLALDLLRTSTDAVLAQAGLELADVRWVLPHQPNGVMLAEFVRALGVSPEQVVPIVQETGSVGAASIPISLDRLLGSGRVRAGDRILMIGVGAGLSSGAALLQTG
jgi:3-oxoacyl-(acyl-carrier-protein) synthase III